MSGPFASAPGKAILCGEYAVLDGAPAVVVAVDRAVTARFGPGGTPSPFVTEALAAAGRALERDFPAEVCLDSTALYDGERKLGFGSSAAVTVATVGLCFAAAGRPLAGEERRVFTLADEAHARAQGTRGSGIDVAAAVWGGVLAFRRAPAGAEVTPLTLPTGLRLTFAYTGRPASTPELVGRVRALGERDPARHAVLIDRLRTLATAFSAALGAGDKVALLAAAAAYGDAMAALGESADAPIVTDELRALAGIARRHGGAGKPSGAGGGDLGVVFTLGEEATAACRRDLAAAGLHVLDVAAPAQGLRWGTT
jgi:phosphomevalonate kinase